MKKINVLFFMCVILFSAKEIYSQPELQVFGFFQSRLSQSDTYFTMDADIPTPIGPVRTNLQKLDNSYISSGVQQLNLLFRSDLTDDFTAWVNLEIVNTFSTERNWGNFNLEEAWMRYKYNDAVNVTAGLLIPKFNYLNETKNKMPLLPYIVRPLVYEASLGGTINISDYIPERAFVQVYGSIPSGSLDFEYAAYFGNAETGYILTEETGGAMSAGTDTTGLRFKLFGGRLGLKYGDLGLGVSATMDKDNQREEIGEDVKRFRIGGDIRFSYANFFMEGEVISVNLSPKNTTEDINKMFCYGTLGYNFTDELFAYTTYSYLEDKQTDFLASGMNGLLFGAGFRPSYNVVIKGQYASYWVADGHMMIPIDPNIPPVQADLELDAKTYAVALSILF